MCRRSPVCRTLSDSVLFFNRFSCTPTTSSMLVLWAGSGGVTAAELPTLHAARVPPACTGEGLVILTKLFHITTQASVPSVRLVVGVVCTHPIEVAIDSLLFILPAYVTVYPFSEQVSLLVPFLVHGRLFQRP